MTAPDRFVALSDPAPGKEDEYAEWYEDVHMDDVAAVPGVATIQRFALSEDGLPDAYTPPCPHRQLGLCTVDGSASDVAAELVRRNADGTFRPTTSIGAAAGWFFRARTALVGAAHDDRDGALLIFTVPTGGQEDIYHRWYDEVHLAEVVATPGIRSAQRFVLDPGPVPERFSSPPPHPNLAIYGLDGSPAAVARSLEQRFTDGTFRMSDALDMTALCVWFFEARTGRRGTTT